MLAPAIPDCIIPSIEIALSPSIEPAAAVYFSGCDSSRIYQCEGAVPLPHLLDVSS